MEPPSSRPDPDDFDLIIAEPAWRRLVPRVETIVRRAAHAAGMQGTVVLAGDRMVRRLNALHRGKNKPTNVLTYEEPAPEAILALGVVRSEAAAQRRRVAHHLAHLVVHAALHLRGEDHAHPGDARRMEMMESRILRGIGVPNPWKRA
ncbi:rRNA maturation RNase YbeY [Rhodopila sp.]|jgi:probable rRNA maturation factor|uniref:rRNA maturation RNase YbeY n=1 Tax=Rhodopila sp. TaxID=2480087 RepID=UPI002B9826E9|nr:rRNA maturation RNase YbeY [Rhodopila sp.]HVZ08093.1 rRNA maturation RNase YbeY [Rhodopila sp.]